MRHLHLIARLLAAVLPALMLLLPAAARAAWLESSSAHFVVYADDSEKDIRRFSEDLERYNAAIAFVTRVKDETPSPSGRVTVFIVRSESEVRKLYGEGSKYVGGFYIPRAGGSLAIVPRVQGGRRELDFSMIALLHEYAHHFLISHSTFPMPRWLSEGSAEFFASASFYPDGSVGVGQAAQHRAAELYLAVDVDAEELLDPELYEKNKGKSYDAFYGKSWLLYHYLVFSEERDGQIGRYLQLMAGGKRPREAAVEAFGEFKQLEKELDAYLARRQIVTFKLPPELLPIAPVTVRAMTAGEAEMMPVRIRSRRGVTPEEASQLLVEARAIAARHPGEPAVLSALAEAEFDAGNNAEAIAAADAALTVDPGQVNAYVQKGYALFRMAPDAEEPAVAFTAARGPFLALNRLEVDHPLPLIFYYRSFVRQGQTPTKVAVAGLERAAELAPFDLGLRMTVAMQQIRDGRMAEARGNLAPVAYNPHGSGLSEAARKVLDLLDSNPKLTGPAAVQAIAKLGVGADATGDDGGDGK
jgi:tetratricopeptide (TPR) repeat protein